jgi:hypothetical protein
MAPSQRTEVNREEIMAQTHNIGPKGCKRRIRVGTGLLAFSGIYVLVLMTLKPKPIWWIFALISTFTGLVYLLQAIEKTCIILARDGVHLLDDKNRAAVQDNELARALRKKSVRLLVKAGLLTSLLVVFYFLVPKN